MLKDWGVTKREHRGTREEESKKISACRFTIVLALSPSTRPQNLTEVSHTKQQLSF